MIKKLRMTNRVASSGEVFFLSGTFFVLPMFEAPKNIFSVLFLLLWSANVLRTGSFGRGCSFNWFILALALVLWVAPFFSDYANIITPLNSAPRWTLLALFVSAAARLDYTDRQLLIIWSALMAGGIAAVLESLWVWQFSGSEYPEFRSVGHVNHSAMYTLVTLATGFGALSLGPWSKKIGLLACISTFVYLVPSKSIVSTVTALCILSIFVWSKHSNRSLLRRLFTSMVVSLGVLLVILVVPAAEGFRAEILERISGEVLFSGRDYIFNSALAVADQHLFLGTGWGSFEVATSEAAVRAALDTKQQAYGDRTYFHVSHGHNLWVTMLIERGIVGVVLVTILLILYVQKFLRIAVSRASLSDLDKGLALGALLVVVSFVVAGLGNTTMMNEHGQAGMAFISVAFGYFRGRDRACAS